jgi:cytidine deaminase
MMTKKNISISWTEFDSIEELNMEDKELVLAAREAAYNAYAPYSKFRVGAAVKLETGLIIKGANVENAAFPSGICAERSALSYSASNFPTVKPLTIAVAALSGESFTKEPVPPCGNCRQVISEEEMRNNKSIRIILYGETRIQIIENGGDLLPLQFSMKNLKTDSHL